MIEAVRRISLVTRDAGALLPFYVDALGFREATRRSMEAALYGASGQAEIVVLRLGAQEIELVQFEHPGAPYPTPHSSHDAFFQHIALVTTDIARALARLPAATAMISRDPPVRLPAASGGVTAAKFRDPEGHPLELLQFPPDAMPARWQGMDPSQTCIGIDHSALVVSDVARSIAFYGALGLQVSSRSLNTGAGQDRLDAVDGARVDVVGLSPQRDTPHVELLCYRAPATAPGPAIADTDVAATRLVVRQAAGGNPFQRKDPDGHRLVLLPD